ncbi:MAG: CD225/dispanin family protein [Deltaproteobacteria bacterium]|uniref:CD225/dispanin family protein n=1 Tax=Candidatus Zymogenus saltonus TaxID=2844893 RepID=A0A9D8KDR2_9DELT|nr:CD225/dispanin family protein [Candidatus Zymogenus saltonus]
MKCPYCGRVGKPERTICEYCGAPLDYIEEVEEQVEDIPDNIPEYTQDRLIGKVPCNIDVYLVFAIFITVFCCMPFGIVAIIFAARAKMFLNRGDYVKAMEEAKTAKAFCWIGFIIGTVIIGIYVFTGFYKTLIEGM